jgi:hypothetical protein
VKRKVPLFETEPIVTVYEVKMKKGGKKNGERRRKGRKISLGRGNFGGVFFSFFSELHRRYQ